MLRSKLFTLSLFALFFAFACQDDDMPGGGIDDEQPGFVDREITGPANPTSYTLELPAFMPGPLLSANNPLTEEGIELGRKLFYDPILSRDSSMSCSSCHLQQLAFTDGLPASFGIRNLPGRRSTMSPVNMVFNPTGFLWDGRFADLESQAIHPVQDVLELDADWENIEQRLRDHPTYPADFRAAFGIGLTSELTRDLAVQAIAQFERTLVSANSRYDQVVYSNEGFFTELEEEGRELFFIEFVQQGVLHPGCSHCHNAPNFGDNLFHNNGLDSVATLEDFPDLGRGGVNDNVFDNGKFRTTTLRNIAVTAPYMHDGRFATLEEVIDHYASGGHGVENENANITGFELTERKKEALVAFLHTLTDEEFLTDERFSNPFE